MIPLLYQGSVKDIRGPVKIAGAKGVVFDYTDAYSVFDWGKMPDALAHKGASLAIIAADWFEKLALADTWKEFSKSPDALALRRGNRFGSAFNELGEQLQTEGLCTHYLGVVSGDESGDGAKMELCSIAERSEPFQKILVNPVSVVKPRISQVVGRSVADYMPTRAASTPRLIPIEVVFRFSCPPGSSLLERVARDPGYLSELGYGHLSVSPSSKWEFPIIELFTKLESTDRPLTLSEALAISGISAAKLQEVLLKTAWVAGWVKAQCARAGLELADGKLEWAIDGPDVEGGPTTDGSLILVDAIGPDELRILSKDGVQLSKEFLRGFYRSTPWYETVVKAKNEAGSQGSAEWKKRVAEGPNPLSPVMKELASQLYQSLANELTGKRWFPNAWSLERVTGELHAASGAP